MTRILATTFTSVLLVALACIAALGLAPGRAGAGQLTASTLTLKMGGFPEVQFSSAGLTGLGAAGSTHWTIQPGAVPTGSAFPTVPLSGAPPITDLTFIINGNAASAVFSASTPQTALVTGLGRVKAYGGITLLAVPLLPGVPGTSVPPPFTGIGITAIANSWTTKTTTVIGSTRSGNDLAFTRMGTNTLVDGQGSVTLVTGINVVTSIAGRLPTFVTLTLRYVPEPSRLAVLAAGVVALAWTARARRRPPPER